MMPQRLLAVERWFLRSGVFLLPLAYFWGTYDRYVLPKLVLGRALVIGLLLLFVARAMVTRTVSFRRTPLDLPLLAFIVSASLSTLVAYNRNVAVFGTYARYDGLLTILTYVALFWLSVQALAGPDDARSLLRVLLASGYVVAAAAIVQSIVDSATQGTLVAAAGSLGQKNVLGIFLVMLAPVAVRELLEADFWSRRILYLNLVAVLSTALVLSLSRSAWLGAAIAEQYLF